MSMLHEFKTFISRGNVVDLAVGVIIGAAFGKIVDSLVGDIVMPVIGRIVGGLDFSNYYIPLNGQGTHLVLAEAKKAGGVIAYGNFVTVSVGFLILAFVIFQMVKLVNALKKAEPAPEPAPEVTPEDVLLLREIRDALRK
ncbi:large-conductance mechanosensitive channel [Undibacterium sp. KW1]|uniref:large conductance mechanosensitive channel protein MscL n=1 Tax=Undibacterium sp. KW1 TaxID=2058624 RepID=UPI001331E63F|nr:large conductance mechanosensitive channel protein MscL [Undibacterium sp. KW1]BBB63212.1 large-conductance mechanosensitive channel [Undibacterium sp. KW1]